MFGIKTHFFGSLRISKSPSPALFGPELNKHTKCVRSRPGSKGHGFKFVWISWSVLILCQCSAFHRSQTTNPRIFCLFLLLPLHEKSKQDGCNFQSISTPKKGGNGKYVPIRAVWLWGLQSGYGVHTLNGYIVTRTMEVFRTLFEKTITNDQNVCMSFRYLNYSLSDPDGDPYPSILNRLIVSTKVLLLSTLLARSTPSLVIIFVAPTVLRL